MDLGGIWEHVSSFPPNSQIKCIRPYQIHSSAFLLMVQKVHNVHNVHRPVEKTCYAVTNAILWLYNYIHICNINILQYLYIYKKTNTCTPRSLIITKKWMVWLEDDLHPVSLPASHSPAQRVERPSSVGPLWENPTDRNGGRFPVTKAVENQGQFFKAVDLCWIRCCFFWFWGDSRWTVMKQHTLKYHSNL